jgi:hypothetical protein
MRRRGQRRPDTSRLSGRSGGPGRSDSGQEPARRLDRFGWAANILRGLSQKLAPHQAGIPQPALRGLSQKLAPHQAGIPQPALRGLSQKLAPHQAGIPQPALRVEDSQLRRPARWPEPIPCHANLGSLPYHVSP